MANNYSYLASYPLSVVLAFGTAPSASSDADARDRRSLHRSNEARSHWRKSKARCFWDGPRMFSLLAATPPHQIHHDGWIIFAQFSVVPDLGIPNTKTGTVESIPPDKFPEVL